ncbi:MAG: O-antigen ligase family protein [Oscillospiraceae bacterium]|nr:O-antigen ligase family protein [Oscillospiraceae bacterium]
MINYENGILKINSKRSFFDVLWGISFFLFMLSVICYSVDQSKNYFYFFVFFLLFGVCAADFLVRKLSFRRIWLPLHTIWYGLFLLLCVISTIWAQSFDVAMLPMSRMVQILVITMFLVYFVDSEDRMELYLNILIAATMYMTVYIFVKTPYDMWFDGFLGQVTNYNTNDVGFALSICFLLSFYKAFVKKKFYMYAVCALTFTAAVLTSSRKALLMCVMGMGMMVVFNYRKKNYMLRVFCFIGVLILAVILIYQIPELYNTVGKRMDRMIDFFMVDKTVDQSLYLRRVFIDMAQSFFADSPIFGHGINNFQYLSGLSGEIATYAHNNYWELAADLGVLGLVAYYWFYAYMLVKLFLQMIDGHKLSLLFLPVMILFLVFEYGMVNYYKMQVQLMIAMSFVTINLNDSIKVRERRKEVAA